MAFLAETRRVVNAWMRPGNTVSLSNATHFLQETFDILGSKQVGLVRADSGFYSDGFLCSLEDRQLCYITAVKFYQPIKTLLTSPQQWISVTKGINICQWEGQLPGWSRPRRLVAVRQDMDIRPKAGGKSSCWMRGLSLMPIGSALMSPI